MNPEELKKLLANISEKLLANISEKLLANISEEKANAKNHPAKAPETMISRDTYPNLELINACERNDFEEVEQLVAKGADVNIGHNGFTPLLHAAMNGNREMVDFLLKEGANPDSKIEDQSQWNGKTADEILKLRAKSLSQALINACERNDFEEVERIVKKQEADINFKHNSFTPLLHAAMNCNQEMFNFLLKQGANLDSKIEDQSQWNGKTVGEIITINILINSCNSGNITQVKKCLEEGADINFKHNGLTPLLHAAMNGNREMVDFLLEEGANPDSKIEDESQWNGKTADEILKLRANNTLINSCNSGDITQVKKCLEEGADINFKKDDLTPLLYAAIRGRNEIVNFLLENGADPNATVTSEYLEKNKFLNQQHLLDATFDQIPGLKISHDKNIALYNACDSNNNELVEQLIKEGANPNFTIRGKTPLHKAAMNSNQKLVKLLIEYKADPETRMKDKNKPAFNGMNVDQILDELVFIRELVKSEKSESVEPEISGTNEFEDN